MKKLIVLILLPFLVTPFGTKANDNYSVEIQALTLVMEQYKEDTESSNELDIKDKKPSYMALKQDECNAKVELVLGNHDIGCNIKNIKIFDIRKTKNITFSHEPVNLENNKTLNICGHYHPKIYIKNNADKLSFRCFAMDMNKNVLYMPAFGDLTGGYPCKKSFKKWAIVSEEEIIEIKS